jgi:hypothetical protein
VAVRVGRPLFFSERRSGRVTRPPEMDDSWGALLIPKSRVGAMNLVGPDRWAGRCGAARPGMDGSWGRTRWWAVLAGILASGSSGRPGRAVMTKTIALLGALDTKGAEYGFVRRCLEQRGHRTLIIDVGVLASPAIAPDIPREEVARAAGADLAALAVKRDRGEAVAVMSRGAAALLPRLYAEGRFDGVLAMGGSGGTSVACAAMRALPLGVPKVMVSTVASGDVSAYVGVKDVTMIPSIVDVAGINRISREVFARAAGAICGMVEAEIPRGQDKPLLAASMFGNTTPAVERAKAILEDHGYEVLVFHATGAGGRTMESLVEAGLVAGVLDLTTTEWADELVGGGRSPPAPRGWRLPPDMGCRRWSCRAALTW